MYIYYIFTIYLIYIQLIFDRLKELNENAGNYSYPTFGRSKLRTLWDEKMAINNLNPPFTWTSQNTRYASLWYRKSFCIGCGGIEIETFEKNYKDYYAFKKELQIHGVTGKNVYSLRKQIDVIWCCGCGQMIHKLELEHIEFEYVNEQKLEFVCHICRHNPMNQETLMKIDIMTGFALSEAAKYVFIVHLVYF